MTMPLNINRTNIIFFKIEEQMQLFCQLRLLINFLKYQHRSKLPKFSFVGASGDLTGEQSAEYFYDNKDIKCDHRLLDKGQLQQVDIEFFVFKTANQYLINFYQSYPKLNPNSFESVKMISLIKSFLYQGPYFIYQMPEHHLNENNLNQFIQAIEYKAVTKQQTIMIASSNQLLWEKVATLKVTRDQHKKFKLQNLWNNANQSNREHHESDDNTGLLFHHNPQKKAA